MCGLADPKDTSLAEHSEIKGVEKHYVWMGTCATNKGAIPSRFGDPSGRSLLNRFRGPTWPPIDHSPCNAKTKLLHY